MHKLNIFFVFIMLLLSLSVNAQTKDTSQIILEVDSLLAASVNSFHQGQYEKAIDYVNQSKDLAEKHFPKTNKRYWTCLGVLGTIYGQLEKYDLAEKNHLAEQEIIKKIEPPLYMELAQNLDNIGTLYFAKSNFKEAERLFLESDAYWEKSTDSIKKDLGAHYNNLGNLYQKLGNWEKSLTYLLKTKEALIEEVGENHPYIPITLGNIGGSLVNLGRLDEAEEIFIKADDMILKLFGEEHIARGQSLNNLGGLYERKGDLERSLSYSEKSIRILEKTFDRNHPTFVLSYKNYGQAHFKIGNYEKADSILKESLEIEKNILGTKHQNYSTTLNMIAQLHHAKREDDLAFKYLKEASEIEIERIKNATSFLSEEELQFYTKKITKNFSAILTLDYLNHGTKQEISNKAFDDILFYKGFLLNTIAEVKNISSSNPELATQLKLIKTYHKQLAREYSKPLFQQVGIDSLETLVNNLEKKIVREVGKYEKAIKQYNWKEIQSSLDENETIIEFVNYIYVNPEFTDSILYAAYIISPKMMGPKFVHLFEEKELKSLFASHDKRRAEYVSDLYSTPDRGVVIESEAKKSLYELIWEPIKNEIGNSKTVYISPSGLLHRINFSAITENGDDYFSTDHDIVRINSSRSLIENNEPESAFNKKAIVYGGIEYDDDNEQEITLQTETDQDIASRSSYTAILNGEKWNYLKWTLDEIESINEVLEKGEYNTSLYSGVEADEKTIKNLNLGNEMPSVLHIASHGFFYPKPDSKENQENKSVFQTSENPMIRSGLILAGANKSWQGDVNITQEEDGILTAYEISQLNLSRTQLVVLSACETGLGDIDASEGVYGLQRAFKIAGAKYLIMSLWQVPDRQTKDFMISFYKNWIDEKMSIPEAFRKTQNTMRERFYDPYFWAGFVLVE